MFRGSSSAGSPQREPESEAAAKENERLAAVMAQRIDDEKSRKKQDEDFWSLFRRQEPSVTNKGDGSEDVRSKDSNASVIVQTKYACCNNPLCFFPVLDLRY